MIAFDAATGANYTAATSGSFSHTCTGTNRGLLAFTYTSGATQSGATVQYNGVSMTYVGNIDSGNGEGVSCWKLANPASGSNTFSWSGLSNSNSRFSVASYTGVDQTDIVHNSNFVAQTADPITPSVTSSIADCWAVVSTTFQGSYVGFNTGTQRQGSSTNKQIIGDSNGTFSTSYAFSIDQAASVAAGSAVIALKPAVAATNSNFLMFMG